jgi:large repetitive protein
MKSTGCRAALQAGGYPALRAHAGVHSSRHRHVHISPRACLLTLALLLVLIVASAIGTSSARAATYNTWTTQTSGTTSTLYGVFFSDANNGWVVGTGGLIRHTVNGGTAWSAQTSTTTQNLRSVFFSSATSGWAVGNGGVIVHTTNGGTTWVAQTSGVTSQLYDVYFLDANNGWAVGTGGVIRHTTNGGTTWSAQTSGSTATFYVVAFTDANNGWVGCAGGAIRHTANGGTAWSAQTSGTTQNLRGMMFTSATSGWAVGNSGAIVHTANGTTWATQTSGTTSQLYDVYFTDANNGWVVGAGGLIRHSVNGGTAWSAQTSGTTQALRGLAYAAGSLWTCGLGGVIRTYLLDVTLPVTTASGLQADNHSGWQATSQTVTLSATDAQSGVSATYYTLDGGARQTYSAPFAVSAQGSHTITYWSVDAGGNTEATRTGYVNIDGSGPTTTATGLQADAHSGWRTTSLSVTLTATDAYSGVGSTTYTIDGTTHLYTGTPFVVSGDGSHAITYWSVDVAGTTETQHAGYVNIDTTSPTTNATGLQADNHSGWQNVSQTVSLAAADASSGVAFTYYTLDGGARQTYGTPFTVSAQGSHPVTYWSVDGVGYTETTHTGYVNVDTASPSIGDDADGAWHRTAVTVHLTPADTGGSGLLAAQYRLQGSSTWSTAAGNALVLPAPADGSGDGIHVYQYRALDNAGNSSSIGNCTVWIDASAPVTTPSGLAADQYSAWRSTSQTVSLAADDGTGSGVTAITYTVDGGASQTYTGSFTVSGAGQHPVTYTATDAAGNVESTRTGWVNISNPFAQSSGLAANNHSSWRTSAGTVDITGTGDHQPLAILYRLNNGSWQTLANPASFQVTAEGSTQVDYYARNTLGVESLHETGFVNIDAAPPATTAGGLRADAHSGWVTSGQAVSLTPADARSGVAATYYTVDGGTQRLYTGAPFLVAGEGSHAVIYWSVDVAGNTETQHTGYVNIDTTGPTTTATNLQANDHSGWAMSTQSVSLAATDAGSGVGHTYYTLDGGAQQTYATPVAVSGNGTHAVTYWSVDVVGTAEAAHTGYVNIDGAAPVSAATGLQANDHSGWRATSQTVNITAGDGSGSGVSSIYYTVDGGAQQTSAGSFIVSAEGSHAIVFWSVDLAGNVEGTHSGYVNIDTSGPVTTPAGLQVNDHSGWAKTAQTVALSAVDSLSGTGAILYTVDGGAQMTYSASFQVSGEGSHPVTYWSTDVVGNSEAVHTRYVNIDATAPATTATSLQADNHTGWQSTSQTVSLAATDALSGSASTFYTLDGGPQQTYGSPFGVSGQASHTVTYWSVDAAGNTESTHTGYVNIDATAPTVSDDADSAWHKIAVPVHLNPADAGGSGVSGTQYRLQGSATWLDATGNTYTVPAPADGSGDGARVYQYRALDGAGNPSATGSCTVRIDTQGPVMTAFGLQPDDLSGWRTTPQVVSFTASDAGAGFSGAYYTIDGGAQKTYNVPFEVSATGQHPLTYWATDVLGNTTVQLTGWVNISNPYAQASANLAPDIHSDWHNAATTVTITGSGDNPPIAIHYRVDGGSWLTAPSNPATITVNGSGQHPLDYYAQNNVGMQSVHATGYVNIDLAAPSTTATGLQADNHSGWTTTGQTVSLAATDILSGVATTTYTIDGGSAQPYTGAPFTVSGGGSHVVTYRSVDLAGNTESTHTGYVNVDTAAPTTTATGLSADDHSGWTTSASPSVTLSGSDGAGSGGVTTYYTLDDGDQTTYSGAFTVSGDGQHPVVFWSVDAMGNTEAARTGYVNIDTAAPATTASGLQTDAVSGWRNTSQSVILAADDSSGCGVGVTRYTIDGGSAQTYTVPFSVATAGSHTVTFWSVDAVGNAETPGSGFVNVDLAAPAVTDDAGTAWHNTAVTVHLTPADTGGSGLAAVQYRPHGATSWTAAAGNSFAVPAPADHTGDGSFPYDYRALDVAGNASVTGTCSVKIDTRAPLTTATGLQTDNHSGWRTTVQGVTLTSDDGAGSGATAIHYTVDGGASQTYGTAIQISTQGSHPVVYWAADGAGNTEAGHTGYVNIDLAVPTVTSDADSAWHNTGVTVHLSPADTGGSGIAATQYRSQGSQTWLDATGNAFEVAAPGDGSNDGAHAFDYRVLDGAGNASATGACTVKIDTQAPVTAATGLQPDNHTGWRTTSQTVSLTPDDAAASGVAITYYTLDGGARTTYAAPFAVSTAGRHRVTYWSVDHLGNVESPRAGYVNIDTSAPVTSATGLAVDDHSGWENTAQLVSLDATDSLSGVAATYYTLDGGSQQTYSGPFTIATDGHHVVTYWSVDATANTEATRTGYVNIDRTAPITTPTGLNADEHSGWRNTAQTVGLAADDGTGSGVVSITYTLDGAGAQTYLTSFNVNTTGQHPVTYFATDAAGNTEIVRTGWVNISNPFAQSTGLTADDHTSWRNTPVTAAITAGGDQGPLSILYQLDSGGQQTVASPAGFTLSTEGTHRVDYYARNSVGIESIHQTGYANIDMTAPTTSAPALQADDQTGWIRTGESIVLNASDALSGVGATHYTIDGGTQQTYSGAFDVSGDGSHAVTYWSADKAGNAETSHTGYVNIDATAPAIHSDAGSVWHNSPVTVHLTASDGLSGVASAEYRLQGSPTWLVASGAVFVVPAPAGGSNDGVYVYEYRAYDNAGNVGSTGSCTVRIDTCAPSTACDADAYWHNSAVTVHLTGADTASGVGRISYRVQGAASWTDASGTSADVSVPTPTDGQPHGVVYEYQTWDCAGNAAAIGTFTVHLDTRMPNTAVSGLPTAAWGHTPVSLSFSATPGDGATIVRTEYSLNGGAGWTPIAVGAPLVISGPGQTTVLYRSVNSAGTVENPARSATVSIDTGKPTCLALKNVKAKAKKTVKLPFKISDTAPSCGTAKVTITIYLKKKVVKRITIASAVTNKNLTYAYKVKLKKGKYTWKVSATDIAGNVQAKISSKTLTVK